MHQLALDFFVLNSKLPQLASSELVRDNLRFNIVSENNFPTAAGMASSASGFAAFACCLALLLDYFGEKVRDFKGDYAVGDYIDSVV